MRSALLMVIGAGGSALALGAACTAFAPSGDAPDGGDAAPGPEAAADAPAACNPAAQEAPVDCSGSCLVTPLFPTFGAERAIVSGTDIYVVKAEQLFAGKIEGTLSQLDEGPAIRGVPTAMAVDESNVYISTTTAHVRVARSGGLAMKLPFAAGSEGGPVFVGTTVLYHLQDTHVTRAPKDGSDTGLSKEVTKTLGLAVAGDVAYWISRTSATEQVVQGPFPETVPHGSVKDAVGFVVKDRFAYAAELDPLGGSTISRISLDDSSRALIVKERGKISSLHLDGSRLYWVASRLPGDGAFVIGSTGLCGGDARVLARDQGPLSNAVSFDDRFVYVTWKSAGPISRISK